MVSALQRNDQKKKEDDDEKFTLPPMPEIHVSLQGRKQDILQLHRQFITERANIQKSVSQGAHGADINKAAHVASFDAALRLFYPRDCRNLITKMCKWVEEVMRHREQCATIKVAMADADLITALDSDGNGKISIHEFCELAKVTGLSKVSTLPPHPFSDLFSVFLQPYSSFLIASLCARQRSACAPNFVRRTLATPASSRWTRWASYYERCASRRARASAPSRRLWNAATRYQRRAKGLAMAGGPRMQARLWGGSLRRRGSHSTRTSSIG